MLSEIIKNPRSLSLLHVFFFFFSHKTKIIHGQKVNLRSGPPFSTQPVLMESSRWAEHSDMPYDLQLYRNQPQSPDKVLKTTKTSDRDISSVRPWLRWFQFLYIQNDKTEKIHPFFTAQFWPKHRRSWCQNCRRRRHCFSPSGPPWMSPPSPLDSKFIDKSIRLVATYIVAVWLENEPVPLSRGGGSWFRRSDC